MPAYRESGRPADPAGAAVDPGKWLYESTGRSLVLHKLLSLFGRPTPRPDIAVHEHGVFIGSGDHRRFAPYRACQVRCHPAEARLQVDGAAEVSLGSRHDALLDVLWAAMARALVPVHLAALDAGEAVQFGPLRLTETGLDCGARSLFWYQVQGCQVSYETVTIQTELHGGPPPIELAIAEVENAIVLAQVIDARKRTPDRLPESPSP